MFSEAATQVVTSLMDISRAVVTELVRFVK